MANTDYLGHDVIPLGIKGVPDVEDCQKRCQSNGGCHYITYVTEEFHNPDMWGICFLKDATGQAKRTTTAGLTSGPKWCPGQ